MAISAEDVKKLREMTGLPLMDCKKALAATDGKFDDAIRWLRESGKKIQSGRADRVTDFGRFGLYFDERAGAMVELKCESAPVAQNEEFIALANDLAKQLALGGDAADTDTLLARSSSTKPGMTLREQKDDLFNRIREVFNVGRMVRFDGRSCGYLHLGGTVHGVLIQASGGSDENLKDVCMHIAASSPAGLTAADLDAQEIERERQILREATLREGKPEPIVDRIVEGQLKKYIGERVLLEQPFVKDASLSVGRFASQNGMTVQRFTHWVLGGTSAK
jgi:elongation factor Ts